MPELLSDDLTYIPNAAIEADQRQTEAKGWAQQQRAALASEWADQQRAELDRMIAEYEQPIAAPPAPGMGDVQRYGQPESAPTPAPPAAPWQGIGDAMGGIGRGVGDAMGGLGELLNGPLAGPLVGGVRQVAGNEQIGRETSTDYNLLEQLAARYHAGDTSVLPEMERLSGALRGPYSEDPFEAARRNPELGKGELLAGAVQGMAASAIAPSFGAGIARNVAAAGVDPGGQVLGTGLSALGKGAGAAKKATDAPRLVADSGETSRYYHGTNAAFDEPDPSKFQNRELYGPGYYMTSDPRVASNYATEGRAAESIAGPNVRPVDVPAGAKLLDDRTPLSTPDFKRILATVKANATPENYEAFLTEIPLPREATGGHIWSALHLAGIRQGDATALLEKAGYDGIVHAGGQNRPLLDEAGKAITHDNLVIFPGSLKKITNPLSGGHGVVASPESFMGSAGRGAGMGAAAGGAEASRQEGATPESIAQGALSGGLMGTVRGGVASVGGAKAAGSALGLVGRLSDSANPANKTLGEIGELSGESAPAMSAARSTGQPPALPEQTAASAAVPPNRRGPQEFAESLPSPESIPPKSAGFERFWNRARNVIEHQGPAGKELADRLREMRDVAETTAGDWVGRLATVRELSDFEFKNFVNAAEGKVKPGNERVAQAVDEWAGVRDDIYGAAKNAGMDVGFLKDYFPHTYDPKLFEGKKNWNANIQHLIQSGQAKSQADAEQILRQARSVVRDRRYGNLEARREVDLPGYERTKDALFGYVEGSAERLAQVRTLGEKDALGLRLISQIEAQGYDAKVAKDLMDVSTRARTYDRDMSKVSGALRTWNVVTKLGLGALTNATQSLNTATVTGGLRTLINTPKAAFSDEAKDFALKAGVTLDGVIKDLREGGGWAGKAGKLSAPGFGTVEKFNRTLAARAGKSYAEDMARKAVKGDQGASKALQTMGLDPAAIARRGGVLSEAEQIRAARNIVERTQFKVDPQDLPGWVDHPMGKIVAQFRTFSYNQTAFVKRELVDPAMKGDARPLIRFLVYGLPVGAATVELQNFLRNRPSEEDPVQAIRQYYQRVGGLGVLGDVMAGLAPSNSKYLPGERYALQAAGTAFGPSMSTLLEGVGSIPGAAQGKPENLERFALKQIPVVGPTIKNTVLPYKPGGRGGTSEGGGQTAAQRYLEKMKGSNPAREYYKRQQSAGR